MKTKEAKPAVLVVDTQHIDEEYFLHSFMFSYYEDDDERATYLDAMKVAMYEENLFAYYEDDDGDEDEGFDA